ncbi:MAG: hypothetical protein JNM25_03130 [Planctomycetes bacterium]|nr:hypothetical protein [Planctomycetota bacterium]
MRFAGILRLGVLACCCLLPSCSGNVLAVGRDSLVTEGVTYRIADVQMTIVRIVVAMEADAQGRERESLRMQVRVENEDIWLREGRPTEAGGLVLTASSAGYRWGATPATATLRITGR